MKTNFTLEEVKSIIAQSMIAAQNIISNNDDPQIDLIIITKIEVSDDLEITYESCELLKTGIYKEK